MQLPDEITQTLTSPPGAVPLHLTQDAWLMAKDLAGQPIPPHRLARLEALPSHHVSPAPKVIPIATARQLPHPPTPAPRRKPFALIALLDRLLRRQAPSPDAPHGREWSTGPTAPLDDLEAMRIRRRNQLCAVMVRTHLDNGGDAA